MSLLNHCHARRKKTKSTCSIIAMARKRRMKSKAVNHASDSEQPDECAIFSDARFPDASSLPNPVVNALRRASEATTPCFGPKYRKIGDRGILRHFRPENRKHRTSLPQSTEVLHRKYGGLCPRSPMFLALKHGIFLNFSPLFLVFCREIRGILPISIHTDSTKLATLDSKTAKNCPKSALKGTRCLVKIFEGSQAHQQVSGRPFTSSFRGSVQVFPPFFRFRKNTADQAVRVLDRYGMVVGNGLVEQGLYGRLDAVFPHIICIFVFIKRSTFINQIALFEQCFCL